MLADDHGVVRAGLHVLLDAQPDMEVVGEAADGFEASRVAGSTEPDVVLLDISMPGPGTRQMIAELLHAAPRSHILVFTMHDDPTQTRLALDAGATGYVVKTAANSELIAAIRAVHSGRTFIDSTRLNEPPAAPTVAARGSRVARLSPRELQVLRFLARGLTNQQIADRVYLSVKTVETYRERVCAKLQLHDRAELFHFAVTEGLLAANGISVTAANVNRLYGYPAGTIE